MRQTKGRDVARGALLAVVAAAVLAVAGGCAGPQPTVSMPATGGPINTGTFPNLNVPPEVAASSITADEKARLEAELGSAKAAQKPRGRTPVTTAETARLRKLATTHADETLRAIEAE